MAAKQHSPKVKIPECGSAAAGLPVSYLCGCEGEKNTARIWLIVSLLVSSVLVSGSQTRRFAAFHFVNFLTIDRTNWTHGARLWDTKHHTFKNICLGVCIDRPGRPPRGVSPLPRRLRSNTQSWRWKRLGCRFAGSGPPPRRALVTGSVSATRQVDIYWFRWLLEGPCMTGPMGDRHRYVPASAHGGGSIHNRDRFLFEDVIEGKVLWEHAEHNSPEGFLKCNVANYSLITQN